MVSGEWRVQNFCGQMCSGFQSGNNNHTSTDTEVFWHSGALQIGLLLLLLLWTMTGLRSKLTQWLQREETSLPLCWVPYATIHTLSFYLPSLHSVVAPGWVSSLKKRTFVNNWSRFFYTPDAVLVIQPSVSQHTRELVTLIPTRVSVC